MNDPVPVPQMNLAHLSEHDVLRIQQGCLDIVRSPHWPRLLELAEVQTVDIALASLSDREQPREFWDGYIKGMAGFLEAVKTQAAIRTQALEQVADKQEGNVSERVKQYLSSRGGGSDPL